MNKMCPNEAVCWHPFHGTEKCGVYVTMANSPNGWGYVCWCTGKVNTVPNKTSLLNKLDSLERDPYAVLQFNLRPDSAKYLRDLVREIKKELRK